MRMLPTTDAEDELSNYIVAAVAEDMAFALDTPAAMLSDGKPTAEFVRHREVRGKQRRIRITVTMENL